MVYNNIVKLKCFLEFNNINYVYCVVFIKDEEKPPLPKRAASLAPRSLNSILKNSKSTYKVQSPKVNSSRDRSNMKEQEQNEKDEDSDSDSSQNASLTPQADDTENVTGRANSFEYFPGNNSFRNKYI